MSRNAVTLNAVKAAHPAPALVEAILNTMGRSWKQTRETLRDVAAHGADSGFPGFTYYSDTRRFYIRHRSAINELVKQEAQEFGRTPIDFVAGFRCLQDTTFDDDKGKWVACKPDNARMTAISRAIYGARMTWDDEDLLIANALAWFALESVARTVDSLF